VELEITRTLAILLFMPTRFGIVNIFLTLETVAAMSVANIQPAQAALFTKTRTGQIFTCGQMAMCKDLQKRQKT
jgi:hypothetical protein